MIYFSSYLAYSKDSHTNPIYDLVKISPGYKISHLIIPYPPLVEADGVTNIYLFKG